MYSKENKCTAVETDVTKNNIINEISSKRKLI
jgi:hypothetical protein